MQKYANHTKATWRGWAWNQIRQRAGKSYGHSPKTVCVLAGDSAGDAVYAKRHNVRCVAIDYVIDNVNTFRKAGGVAVQDSLKNQMIALTPEAIIADFVNGITAENHALLLDATHICDAVVFNFLRGRDVHGGKMAEVMKDGMYTVPHYKGGDVVAEHVGKHRGKMTALVIGYAVAKMWYEIPPSISVVPHAVFENLQPSFYSYKSKDSGQWFDSVALTTKAFRIHETKEWVASLAPADSRRKAAAAKAILTKGKRQQ